LAVVVVGFGGGLAVTVRTFDITFIAFFIKPPVFISDGIFIVVLHDFYLISHDFHFILRQGICRLPNKRHNNSGTRPRPVLRRQLTNSFESALYILLVSGVD
jgi:hypothetical protein